MERILAVAGILTAISVCGFSQAKDKASGGAEEAVMRIERELLAALLKGDASANTST